MLKTIYGVVWVQSNWAFLEETIMKGTSVKFGPLTDECLNTVF
jgi:hypothetical protein